jgi:CMP-N-acetylneuraminic acid synthetase
VAEKKILTIIPARGGSKGILRKNLHLINGNPLIYYTVKLVQEVGGTLIPFLSTDDDEIIDYCASLGLSTGYKRPASLATDESPTIDAVFHAMEFYEEKEGVKLDAVLLLQPTSPIRLVSELKEAVMIFIEKSLKSLVSVARMREHPYECVIENSGSWNFLSKPDNQLTRRQLYPNNFYFIDGSFYLATPEFLRENKSFLLEGISYLYQSKIKYSIDIDEIEDMKIAEIILSKGEFS